MANTKEIYDEYTEKIKNVSIEKIPEVLSKDLADKSGDAYGTIAVLGAYYNLVKGQISSIEEYCHTCISIIIKNNNLLERDFDKIIRDKFLTDLILNLGSDDVIQEFLGQAKKRRLEDPSYDDIYNKVVEQFDARRLSINNMPDEHDIVNTEKQKISSQIDDVNKETLQDNVKKYNDTDDKDITINKDVVIEKANKKVSKTGDKKVIMTFTMDPTIKEHKKVNSPIVNSLSKGRFNTLCKTMDKYMKWLEKTDLKIETEEIIDANGNQVTNVKVQNGKVYNLTASCKNKTKEIINRNSGKIQKARKRCGDLRKGIAGALKRMLGEEKTAKITNAMGNAAATISNKANEYAEKVYENVDKMLQYSPETLEKLKQKRVQAKSGNFVTNSNQMNNNPGMAI